MVEKIKKPHREMNIPMTDNIKSRSRVGNKPSALAGRNARRCRGLDATAEKKKGGGELNTPY